MKIGIIIPSLGIGGGQRIALDIASNNSNIFFIIIGKKEYNSFESFAEKYHKVYYLNKNKGIDLSIFNKINNIVNIENPNVVHFHLAVSLYGLIPLFFKKKIKLIYTFHTIAENDSKGYIRKLCKIGIKYRGMIPVAITETVKSSIEKIHEVKNVKLIHNGINLNNYYNSVKNDNKVELITIGQIWDAKNHSFMIDIIFELKNKGYNNFELIILGDGPLKGDIEKKINALNLRENVKLMGNVDNVNDYLSKADIFILTSRYEGLSIATLEAMASGLPIVSTDVGGMGDIVTTNGYLIPENNLELFLSKIIELIENKDTRRKMGYNSRILVEKYDVNTMRKKYYELYYHEVGKYE